MGIFPQDSFNSMNIVNQPAKEIPPADLINNLPIHDVASSKDDIIDISEADLAMLDAIEQQVLSTQNATVPPIIYGTSSIPSSSYKIWKMDEIPLYFRLKIISIEKSDLYRRTRIVANCCEDEYISAQSKSSDIHHNNSTISFVSDPIFIDLVEDWYHFSMTDGDVLQSGELIHIVNIDGLALQSLATSNSYLNPVVHQNNSAIVASLQPLTLRISNEAGLLIVAPDTYVSPTKVADSCQCSRRGVLVDRFRSFSLPSVAATMGKVRHYFIEVRIKCALYYFSETLLVILPFQM